MIGTRQAAVGREHRARCVDQLQSSHRKITVINRELYRETVMEQDLVAERIRNFLGQHFPATRNVQDEQSLLGGGLIDSLGILEVVTFLEKEFGFVVSDEELLPENFESVRSLSNFVQQKRNGAS